MAVATFDFTNLRVILPVGDVTIDVERDLYSAWKRAVLVGTNMGAPPAFRPSVGGDSLSPGIEAGAYFFLQNQDGWRIRPAEADATVTVVGNLIAEDPDLPLTVPTLGAFTVLLNGLQPITQNVDIILTQQTERLTALQFLIESTRGNHSGFGDVFYWNPVTGNDTNSGKTPAEAVLTFAQAHTLVTDGNDDVVFIVNDSPSAVVVTERLNITKNNVHVRGPGVSANVLFRPVDDADDAIKVTGRGCSLSSFSAETTASGTPRSVLNIDGTTGGGARLADIVISASTNHGIVCVEGDFHSFSNVFIRSCAGDGINFLDVEDALVAECQFESNGGWAVQVLSTDGTTRSRFVRFINNMSHHNGPGSINIGANSHMTIIDVTNYFAIASGNDLIVDNGQFTHNELAERGVLVLPTQMLLVQQMLAGNATISADNQTITVFNTDGITPLATFSISVDGRIRTNTT